MQNHMKLATWNVNSLRVRLEHVLEWLAPGEGVQSAGKDMDVLVLQELKLSDDQFPAQAFEDIGYHSVFLGQKTYNGVALLSRHPIEHVVKNIPQHDDEMARVISAEVLGLRVVGAYFPNGQEPGSEKFAYKMRWLEALERWLQTLCKSTTPVVLMGDYNITHIDLDVWDPEGLRDTIHCTQEERAHFQALLDLGLIDAFRTLNPEKKTFSWWDYRGGGFRRNHGLRIDHILVSQALRSNLLNCDVDPIPRKKERPSDHAPVWVELIHDHA
jgi:exodeoxyribonuclease-3